MKSKRITAAQRLQHSSLLGNARADDCGVPTASVLRPGQASPGTSNCCEGAPGPVLAPKQQSGHGPPEADLWVSICWLGSLSKQYNAFGASLVAQTVKNLPAMQDPRVQFLGGEDTLQKEIMPWRRKLCPIPVSCLENSMDRGACWLQSMWLQRVGHD